MNTSHTVAVTVLVLALLMGLIGHKSRSIGPVLHLGMGIGLAVGITSTWLLWQAAA